MQRKKRGANLFKYKNGISHDLFFNVFELILAAIVIIALFRFVNDVAEQTIFAKNYFARDISLLVNALYAAPGKVTYTYAENTSKFILDFNDNKLTVYEEGDSEDKRNIFYLYAENKNLPFQDTTLRYQEDKKINFLKSGINLAVSQDTQAIQSPQASFGNAKEFFNELKSSSYFSGFTDVFLWGLTANAWRESGFRSNANGDPKEDARAIQVDGTYYCSFGYWQLNVCGGSGGDFINYYSLNANNKEQVYDAITDKDKQFEYVAEKMKELFPRGSGRGYDDESKSAEYFGRQIAFRFEKCNGCGESGTETRDRGRLAAKYVEDYALV